MQTSAGKGLADSASPALIGSWLLVIVADVLLAEFVSARFVVAALALGNTVGQTAVAVPLVLATRRICGRAVVQGAGHAAMAGLAAGPRASASAWPRRPAGSCWLSLWPSSRQAAPSSRSG